MLLHCLCSKSCVAVPGHKVNFNLTSVMSYSYVGKGKSCRQSHTQNTSLHNLFGVVVAINYVI